jgi:hypothetical protein
MKKTDFSLITLTHALADHFGVAKRPIRYFDVPKRGNLTIDECLYVIERFQDLVKREICVKKDPSNPICYQRVKSDVEAKEKQGSTYKKDYDAIYRNKMSDSDMARVEDEARKLIDLLQKNLKTKIPLGVAKIAIESNLNPLVLKEVYDRAVGAYATSGSRAGMSAEQWGYGRIYAFIMCYLHNKNGKYNSQRFMKNKTDYDLFEQL